MITQFQKSRIALVAICLFLCAAGCVRKPTSTADVPRSISQTYKISVAPFTQPLNSGQLIAGQIPETQGAIPLDALLALDMKLRDVLMTRTKRQYNFIPRRDLHRELDITHNTTQPGGLSRWIEYGRKHDAQLLLVPQVLDWHERQGSQAGVTESAHVRVEFYLLNIAGGEPANRSIFEEKQVGLVENLLTVGDFVKRKGQWVSAEQLAVDGMDKAVKELGL